MSERLDELGRRIERLVLEPEAISAPFTRLFRPLLYRIGWRPTARVFRVTRMVEAFREPNNEGLEKRFDQALEELHDNVKQVERATVINRRPLVAHAAWLRRLYELLVYAERALGAVNAEAGEAEEASAGDVVRGTDDAGLLPPLSLVDASDSGDTTETGVEPVSAGDVAADSYGVDPSRLLELQLDAIDEVLGAARDEDESLARRRRLLEAARQLLLETNAALPLDKPGVQARLRVIARHITQINRLEGVGLRSEVGLLHQARSALSRGERDKLFAALQALGHSARARRDPAALALTSAALRETLGGAGVPADAHVQESAQRSAAELFGGEVVDAIVSGYERGKGFQHQASGEQSYDDFMVELLTDYYAPGSERATLAAAVAVDGCVEVGGVLSPVRVDEEYRIRTMVKFPTQELTFVPATDPDDLANAVITDPRTVLLDLAAGRLLTRRYVREQIGSRKRTVMAGEVRVYVLDGSTSMIGPRARMRDALLIAELATLARRLDNPHRSVRTVLYYRYFNSSLLPVHRVATPAEAIAAIREITATPRTGATNIESALVASIEQIRSAKESDPDLAQAQIVLITDGMAWLNEGRVNKARLGLGDLPVGISVIALGEENPALRALVAKQRSKGERAFYHFLPDDHLEQVSSGRIDDEVPVHLPAVSWQDWQGHAAPEALHQRLTPILQQLAELHRDRQRAGLRQNEGDAATAAGDGQRAHAEATFGDVRSLERRFARWFPQPERAAVKQVMPEAGTQERDDLESVIVALATVAEVVELVDSAEAARKADAIELLHRLLPNARLSPARYDAVLATYTGAVAGALEAVHAATKHGVWRRYEMPS